MFLRLFTVAGDVISSESICENLLKKLEKYICKKTYISNQSYWKINNIFKVEIRLNLCEKIPQNVLNSFFASVADKWKEYGPPVSEVLISNTLDYCNFKCDDIIMVNIFFEEFEINNNC